jgi:hypothetical protein
VAGLVHVQAGFLRQSGGQRFVGGLHGRAGLAEQLGQLAAGEAQAEDVATEAGGGGEGAVAGAFEPGDQGRQPRADQSGPLDLRRQGGVVRSPAVRTPGGVSAMLGDDQRRLGHLDLLKRSRRLPRFQLQARAAVGAVVEAVVFDLVKLVGRKR